MGNGYSFSANILLPCDWWNTVSPTLKTNESTQVKVIKISSTMIMNQLLDKTPNYAYIQWHCIHKLLGYSDLVKFLYCLHPISNDCLQSSGLEWSFEINHLEKLCISARLRISHPS